VIRGCTECHGHDFGGSVILEEPGFGRIVASNLTAGQGGIGAAYSEEDWVRAIANGVDPYGRALLAMPSAEYHQLSDEDLGALLAYLMSLEPVDRQLPGNEIGLPLRALVVAGLIPGPEAERIEHNAPRPEAPERGITAQYGQYLALTCTGCHGAGFSGGPVPGAPPDALPAPNLTPGGDLAGWTEADFVRTLRTGVTPLDHNLDPEQMPWPVLGQMTDDELKAVWLYLRSLPATEYSNH
jgi:mono/diheme cytochrome c family protein